MKKLSAMLTVAMLGLMSSVSVAQFNDMTPTTNMIGLTKQTNPVRAAVWAAKDHFSPAPYYAYSNAGVVAQRTHEWNRQMAQSNAWHGNYNHWRWQRPTALVVPPTASFQSEYNWGVGQTRSIPIYHQYGRGGAGVMTSGGGFGFGQHNYWPSSTSQFGVYPVRGPWHH